VEYNAPPIPIGPVQLVVGISGFGEWYLEGGLQAGVAYDDTPLNAQTILTTTGAVAGTKIAGASLGTVAAAGALTAILTAPGDYRVLAGPVFTPGASLSVAAYAGIGFGIPGVSIGVEGTVSIFAISLPAEARLSVVRKRDPDTRPTSSSVFAGESLDGFGLFSENTKLGFGFGSRLQLSALDGRVDLAARVRLLFVRKTFRKTIANWRGFQKVFNVMSTQQGEAISGVEDFGKFAPRVAVTGIENLTTDEPVASPNPDAIYTGILGSETCSNED
jgi:hypothetical protein